MSTLRILFVGHIHPYQTTVARGDAFRELDIPIEVVDERDTVGGSGPFVYRFTAWTLLTPPVFAFNRQILEGARRFEPNVVWIEKGTCVFPRTLRALRRDRRKLLVYHNTDDWKSKVPFNRIKSRYLLSGLDLYDVHVTSNLHNARELREAGYARVHHMELAANPAIAHPGPISEEDRRALGAGVGFIGHWEPVTERLMLHLLRNGIPLKIYGGGWDHAAAGRELRDVCQQRALWGDEFARAVLSFDINLGIVSKLNRSHTASRTFQVPALGGFLLHERNEVVTRYFKEGVEAEFFGSEDELLEKCRYYLDHPEERRRIAAAGRRRCEASGYFEINRVREVLSLLEEALGELQSTT